MFKGQMHLRNTSFAGDLVDVQKFFKFYLNKPQKEKLLCTFK